jgi:hypothetical protein
MWPGVFLYLRKIANARFLAASLETREGLLPRTEGREQAEPLLKSSRAGTQGEFARSWSAGSRRTQPEEPAQPGF